MAENWYPHIPAYQGIHLFGVLRSSKTGIQESYPGWWLPDPHHHPQMLFTKRNCFSALPVVLFDNGWLSPTGRGLLPVLNLNSTKQPLGKDTANVECFLKDFSVIMNSTEFGPCSLATTNGLTWTFSNLLAPWMLNFIVDMINLSPTWNTDSSWCLSH